jgi:indole-3-glycerol phosphate synthase
MIPDILAKICVVKRQEIAALKAGDEDALARAAAEQAAPRGFRAALDDAPGVALIAEVKKASPSKGLIRADFDHRAIARTYAECGATALSVLTDAPFFQGAPAYLSDIRVDVTLPLLRKDFILDDVQIVQARALGADAYLLIVATLTPQELAALIATGRRLGMDALVEVHDEAEMVIAADVGADLIGVNNRDLHTFEVRLATTERLAPLAPNDALLVGESGIRSAADVRRLHAAGTKAILVGESLMRADDLAAATRELAEAV